MVPVRRQSPREHRPLSRWRNSGSCQRRRRMMSEHVRGTSGRRSSVTAAAGTNVQRPPSTSRMFHVSISSVGAASLPPGGGRDGDVTRIGTTSSSLEHSNAELCCPTVIVEPRVTCATPASHSASRNKTIEDGRHLAVVQSCEAIGVELPPRVRAAMNELHCETMNGQARATTVWL